MPGYHGLQINLTFDPSLSSKALNLLSGVSISQLTYTGTNALVSFSMVLLGHMVVFSVCCYQTCLVLGIHCVEM